MNENVENLGRVGDIIDVKPGYARNYLLPRELALLPTKHNLEIMKYKRIKAQKQLELEKLSAMEQKKKLEELTITISRKAGESDTLFGSVTATDIQAELEKMGLTLEKKKFHMDEHHIKKLGLHSCKIKLMEEVEAELKIEVLREGEPEPEENTEVVEEETAPEAEAAVETETEEKTTEE
jgi:large subunit ribosomal protein L9